MDRKDVKKQNNRDYIKKANKSQDQIAPNQFTSTIQENAINDSVFKTKKSEY